jgi:hypothetical protein
MYYSFFGRYKRIKVERGFNLEKLFRKRVRRSGLFFVFVTVFSCIILCIVNNGGLIPSKEHRSRWGEDFSGM